MTGIKHEAHVRNDTVACIKNPKKPRYVRVCNIATVLRENKSQKMKRNQRMDWEGVRVGAKIHD